MRHAGAAAAVVLAFSGEGALAVPIDVIRQCASSASDRLVGIEKLAAACPDLQSAISASAMDQVLPAGWREHLSAAKLQDWVEIAARYDAANARLSPNTRSLDALLRGLKPQAPATETWWGSFKKWWQDWLARSDSAFARWARELSGRVRVSQRMISVVAYCLTAIIAMVVLIVGLRGFFLWRERRQASQAGQQRVPQPPNLGAAPGEPDQPNSAEEHLNRVLRALVMRLLETGRLQGERSLTHRELVRRSRFDDEAQRGAFNDVITVAEALVYGPRGAAQSAIAHAIQLGESLLTKLQPAAR